MTPGSGMIERSHSRTHHLFNRSASVRGLAQEVAHHRAEASMLCGTDGDLEGRREYSFMADTARDIERRIRNGAKPHEEG